MKLAAFLPLPSSSLGSLLHRRPVSTLLTLLLELLELQMLFLLHLISSKTRINKGKGQTFLRRTLTAGGSGRSRVCVQGDEVGAEHTLAVLRRTF